MSNERRSQTPENHKKELRDVDLSVVVPMYCEGPLVHRSVAAIRAELERTGRSFELVCVDDGSSDNTLTLLREASLRDPQVVVVALSRNFGKESAMAAGLDVASGRAVLLMDADLQHPPELIPRMVELWSEGYDVVNAVKESRGDESLTYKAFASTFNWLMGGAAGKSFRGASDFKLIDRQVVDALANCPERNRFFRGLVAWVGFRTVEVPFAVAERAGGTTKWTLSGLVRYSLRNIIAFSALPLRFVAVLGFSVLLIAAALALQTFYRWFTGTALSGFTTVILLQIALGGVLLASLGVVALYLAELYAEIKQRPVFIVRRERPAPSASAAVASSRARNAVDEEMKS